MRCTPGFGLNLGWPCQLLNLTQPQPNFNHYYYIILTELYPKTGWITFKSCFKHVYIGGLFVKWICAAPKSNIYEIQTTPNKSSLNQIPSPIWRFNSTSTQTFPLQIPTTPIDLISSEARDASHHLASSFTSRHFIHPITIPLKPS